MSNHNAETLTLSQINQKGTIIEPRRSLTFPIPENVQDWTHIQFGLLYSLTDLTEPEAQLTDMSGFTDVSDGTLSSKFWFGLTTNDNGVLPGTGDFSEDLFRGMGSPLDRWSIGVRVLDSGTLADRTGSSSTTFHDVLLGGSSLIDSDPFILLNFVEDGNISQFYNQFATLWGIDVEILNKGASNQSMVFKFVGHNSSGAPARLAYSDINEINLVNGLGAAPISSGNNIVHNDGVDPRTIPQNILFHWPVYSLWRIRLHGALLIKKA